jgi:hypothetical protein
VTNFSSLLLNLFIAALAAGVVAHTRADDARKADLAECVDGWEESATLNATCLAVADECRALVMGGACSCWMPDEVPR